MGISLLLLNVQYLKKLSQLVSGSTLFKPFILYHHRYILVTITVGPVHIQSLFYLHIMTLSEAAQNIHESHFYTRTTRNNLTVHENDCKLPKFIPLTQDFSMLALLTLGPNQFLLVGVHSRCLAAPPASICR